MRHVTHDASKSIGPNCGNSISRYWRAADQTSGVTDTKVALCGVTLAALRQEKYRQNANCITSEVLTSIIVSELCVGGWQVPTSAISYFCTGSVSRDGPSFRIFSQMKATRMAQIRSAWTALKQYPETVFWRGRWKKTREKSPDTVFLFFLSLLFGHGNTNS